MGTAKELTGEGMSVALIFSFCLIQHPLNPMEDVQQDTQQGFVTLVNCYTGIGTSQPSQGGKKKKRERNIAKMPYMFPGFVFL